MNFVSTSLSEGMNHRLACLGKWTEAFCWRRVAALFQLPLLTCHDIYPVCIYTFKCISFHLYSFVTRILHTWPIFYFSVQWETLTLCCVDLLIG